jgi:hypothetical protein
MQKDDKTMALEWQTQIKPYDRYVVARLGGAKNVCATVQRAGSSAVESCTVEEAMSKYEKNGARHWCGGDKSIGQVELYEILRQTL